MQPRNPYPRARPFRYFCFFTMAGVCALLLVDPARSAGQLLPAVLFCLTWPVLADLWWARREVVAAESTRLALRVHLAEALLAGLAFGWAVLPPLPALAALLAVLAGMTAQAGWRFLRRVVPLTAVGAGAGLMVAPRWTASSTLLADLLAALFILGFAVGLAEVSFRRALHLHTGQRRALGRAEQLENLAGSMQAYLAPSLRARIRQTAADPRGRGGHRDRRWVSVVFVDLVGFTELASRMEAESLAAMLDEYLVEVCALARTEGGEVAKVLGDGVLAAFGLDRAADRRTLAVGAVRFCRGLQRLRERLTRRWRDRGDIIPLQVRVGIASGYCTVGDWGSPDHREFTLIGSPVNLASRLQAHAAVDGALLDPATAALVEGFVELGTPMDLQVRGIGTVVACALAGDPVDLPPASAKVPRPSPAPECDNPDGKDIPAGVPR